MLKEPLGRRAGQCPDKGADITVAGTLVAIDGQGVLIQGEAGTGKSEAALGLLDRGHRLVADDAVRLTGGADAAPRGKAAPLLAGRLAVRGLGVLDVARLYGAAAVAASAPINLVVRLAADDDADPLHGAWARTELLGASLPAVTLRPARALPLLIETALRRQSGGGDTASAALIRRQRRLLGPGQP